MSRRMWHHQHSSHTLAYVQVVHLNKIFFRNSSHYTVNDVMRQNTAHIGNGLKSNLTWPLYVWPLYVWPLCVWPLYVWHLRVWPLYMQMCIVYLLYLRHCRRNTRLWRGRGEDSICSVVSPEKGWKKGMVDGGGGGWWDHTAINSLDPCSLNTESLHWIHAHSTLSRYTGSTLTQHWATTLDPRSLNTQQLHWIHAHSTLSHYTGSTLTQHSAITLDPHSLNTEPLHWIHTHSTSKHPLTHWIHINEPCWVWDEEVLD